MTEIEPLISINGVTLSEPQANAVRVALEAYRTYLEDATVKEGLGKIGTLYLEKVLEVWALMEKPAK